MKECPQCESPLNRLVGPDGHRVEPVLMPWTGVVVEQKRMDVIYVCPRCEHCE